MRIEPLLSFAAVVEQGSFQRAASMLYLTQPAVSMNIKQLEREYGQPLLTRTRKRGFSLTPLGEELYELTRELRAQLEKIERHKQDALRTMRAEIVIQGNSLGGLNLLTPLSAKFQEMHPNVHFSITQTKTAQVLENLWNGKIDLALMITSELQAGLEPVFIWNDAVTVIVPPNHPYANQLVSCKELSKSPLILAHKESASRHIIDITFKKHADAPANSMIELGNPEAIKQTVLALNKPGMILSTSVKNELSSGALASVRTDVQMECQHVLFYKKEQTLSNTLKQFIGFLTAEWQKMTQQASLSFPPNMENNAI